MMSEPEAPSVASTESEPDGGKPEAPSVASTEFEPVGGGGASEFEQAYFQEKELPLHVEFLYFLSENKKWWLLPIIIVIGLVGIFAVLSSSGAAPFIYAVF